jgi:hypothetical protein
MIYNNLVISREINECIFSSAHWTYLEHKENKVRAEIISQNSWELTLSKVLICQLIIFNRGRKFPSSIGEESGSWVPLVAATPPLT